MNRLDPPGFLDDMNDAQKNEHALESPIRTMVRAINSLIQQKVRQAVRQTRLRLKVWHNQPTLRMEESLFQA